MYQNLELVRTSEEKSEEKYNLIIDGVLVLENVSLDEAIKEIERNEL